MASLATSAKAKLLGGVIKQIFGFSPQIVYHETYAEIIFTKDQEKVMTVWIEKQMERKEPGDIHLNLLPILLPVIIKKVGVYLGLTFLGGYGLGKIS